MTATSEEVLIAPERRTLEAFVDDQRHEVAALLDGLTEEQARRRLVPSRTTLLGLLKHLTVVEQVWFRVAFSGDTRAALGLPEDIDESFIVTDDDTVASVLAEYHRVCEEARSIAASYQLDDVARHNRRSPLTLRWIYLHLVREVARHAGHGDILREQILASQDR